MAGSHKSFIDFLKSTKIENSHFNPFQISLSLLFRQGLNLSEDDLVVNNFGDPRVGAPVTAFTVSQVEISNSVVLTYCCLPRLLSLDFRSEIASFRWDSNKLGTCFFTTLFKKN